MAVVDFVEHPRADLLSSVFRTCPLKSSSIDVTVPQSLAVTHMLDLESFQLRYIVLRF